MKRFVATLAVAGIALSACSSNEAATVNGHTITLSDVAAVQKDLEADGSKILVDPLINVMISAAATKDAAKEHGLAPTAETRQASIEQLGLTGIELSEQTDELLDFYSLALQSQNGGLAGEDIAALNEAITTAEVEVNPRFGTWDSATGSITKTTADYIAK